MPPNDNTVVMEGVRIIFRNFAGKEGQYNREGDRNFAVLLDEQTADPMGQDGWNVKMLRPRSDEEGEEVVDNKRIANFDEEKAEEERKKKAAAKKPAARTK